MLRKTCKVGLALISVVWGIQWYALAQTATGSISGVVRDESGAVIPGVNVTVTNVDKGISNSLVTDAAGRYNVPSLIPGHYEIQAQVSGFETGVRKGIQLTVGSNLEISIVLKIGQVTQQTVVTAEAPIVETATSTVSGLVDDQTIRELPLNGRSFDQLITLQSSAPAFRSRSHGAPGGSGTSTLYTVSGARTQANLYLMDGTQMVSGANISTLPGGLLGVNMGVDAVQEFAILTSNYSSAYGKKGGGIINIATRSGTNELHGSGVEFLRNSVLDARNFFDPTPQPASFRRNQFGGALGGPVRKDQSFFFGSYEGLREGLGLTTIAIVPDENAKRGLLPDPQNPGQFINVGVDPAVKPYLEALWPLPNGRNFGDGLGQYLSNPKQISIQDFFLLRFDQRISDTNSFFARYNFTRAFRTYPDDVGIFGEEDRSRDQMLTMEWKNAHSQTVNALRLGFSRGHSITSGGSIPLVSLDPSLRFGSTSDLPGSINFQSAGGRDPITPGGAGATTKKYVLNQFDVADQVYRFVGPHSLQFGAQVQRIQNNDRYAPSAAAPWGVFEFVDIQAFLQKRPTLFTGLIPGSHDPTKAYRQIYFSTYFQDDYKILPNLTLNLGLRYELMTVPVEVNGRISNYHYQFVNGFRVLDPLPTLGGSFWQPSHDTFAPRVGIAWDPFRDGKLAVRAGFGIFYDQNDSEHRFFTSTNPPYVTSVQVSNPPFPLGLSGTGGTIPLPAPDAVDVAFKVPTRIQYSLGLQRQVTANTAFSIGYVGSQSKHLTNLMDTNTAVPQFQADGTVFYPSGAPRFQRALGRTRFVKTDANSSYHSLQLDFMQRPSRGVRYKVSYTFAKNIDEASNTVSAQADGVRTGPQNPFDRRAERGLSAFDVRQNFVTNFTYDVPSMTRSGFAGKLLGGWQLGGILTLAAGTPFTAYTSFNRSRDLSRGQADRPNLKAGSSNNPVLGGPDRYFDPAGLELPPAGYYGNLGRDTMIGPGLANVDFTLTKATALTERLKVDFRAEFFNLFNRANFNLPSNVIFNSNGSLRGTAGSVVTTTTTSRQIQFGLKLGF